MFSISLLVLAAATRPCSPFCAAFGWVIVRGRVRSFKRFFVCLRPYRCSPASPLPFYRQREPETLQNRHAHPNHRSRRKSPPPPPKHGRERTPPRPRKPGKITGAKKSLHMHRPDLSRHTARCTTPRCIACEKITPDTHHPAAAAQPTSSISAVEVALPGCLAAPARAHGSGEKAEKRIAPARLRAFAHAMHPSHSSESIVGREEREEDAPSSRANGDNHRRQKTRAAWFC